MLHDVIEGCAHGVRWAFQGFPDRTDVRSYPRRSDRKYGALYWLGFRLSAAVVGVGAAAGMIISVFVLALLAGP